jgi:hypothetical protein
MEAKAADRRQGAIRPKAGARSRGASGPRSIAIIPDRPSEDGIGVAEKKRPNSVEENGGSSNLNKSKSASDGSAS